MNEKEKTVSLLVFSITTTIFMSLLYLVMHLLAYAAGTRVIGKYSVILLSVVGMESYWIMFPILILLNIVVFVLLLISIFALKADNFKSARTYWLISTILLALLGIVTLVVGFITLLGAGSTLVLFRHISKLLKEGEDGGVPERYHRQKIRKPAVMTSVFIVLILVLSSFILLFVPALSNAQYRMLNHIDWETAPKTNTPPMKDTDHDGLADIKENYIFGTNMTKWDTDGDYMPDGWEALHAKRNKLTHELNPDPNKPDAFANPDGDSFDYSKFYNIFTDVFNRRDEEGNNKIDVYDWNSNGNTTFYIKIDASTIDPYAPQNGKYGAVTRLVANEEDFWDNENLTNFKEYYISTKLGYKADDWKTWGKALNPANPDTDGDGMDDGYESFFWLASRYRIGTTLIPPDFPMSPINGTDASDDPSTPQLDNDPDGDTLTNLEEYKIGTYPNTPDSDNDSAVDDPNSPYWFGDAAEINYQDTSNGKSPDPTNPDTDGDGMPDGWEALHNLHPCNASDQFLDLDHDGLPNYLEFSFPSWHVNWWTADYNHDGKITKDERRSTDPFNPDTDGDGMPDGWEAYSMLASSNLVEKVIVGDVTTYKVPLNPTVKDAKLDVDRWEAGFNTTPDGLTNIEEYWNQTNPLYPDTDEDGLLDGEEVKDGFHGELIDGIYYTLNFAAKYTTNASSKDTDMDSNQTNASRHLYDWEEIHGMQWELQDGIDNDGDGQIDEKDGSEGVSFPPTNASNPDTDIDGLTDEMEIFGFYWNDPLGQFTGWIKTDPTNKDTDFDGIPDKQEIDPIQNPNAFRIINPTNPVMSDTDGDGLMDGLEIKTDFFPYVDPAKITQKAIKDQGRLQDNDDDNDGNLNEDGNDGLDNDFDGKTDEDPTNDIDFTDPRNPDTDGDGMPDGWEAKMGVNLTQWGPKDTDVTPEWIVNPLDPTDKYKDPDNDGLTNIEEYRHHTDPLNPDTDGDGLPDGWEAKYSKYVFFDNVGLWGDNLNPTLADSDYDGIPDGAEDYDDDGYHFRMWDDEKQMYVWHNETFNNTEEYNIGKLNESINQYGFRGIREDTTDPNDPDTDNDGMNDGWEVYLDDRDDDLMPTGYEEWMAELHPNDAASFNIESNDTNGNGIIDGLEDWDSDSYLNWWEAMNHTDCLDKNSVPHKVTRALVNSDNRETPVNLKRANFNPPTSNDSQDIAIQQGKSKVAMVSVERKQKR